MQIGQSFISEDWDDIDVSHDSKSLEKLIQRKYDGVYHQRNFITNEMKKIFMADECNFYRIQTPSHQPVKLPGQVILNQLHKKKTYDVFEINHYDDRGDADAVTSVDRIYADSANVKLNNVVARLVNKLSATNHELATLSYKFNKLKDHH